MSKIPLYPSSVAPNEDDLLIIEDSVTANTKKIKRSDLLGGNTITATNDIATDSIAGITDADSGTVFGVSVTNSQISSDNVTGQKKSFVRGSNFAGSVPSSAFTPASVTGVTTTITVPTGKNIRISFGSSFVSTSATSNERGLSLCDSATVLVSAIAIGSGVISSCCQTYDFVGDNASHTFNLKASTNVTTGTFDIRSPYLSWEIYTPVV